MSDGRDQSTRDERIELALAVLMALAAVGTAWAGFQSAQWGGVQANAYATANADRTESNRAYTEAGQDRIIDLSTFGSWLTALDDEMLADPSTEPSDLVQPGDEAVDGFLFVRFRDEFQPAMEAWLATEPFTAQDAPSTPFAMPEYQLAAEARAQSLLERADASSAQARVANQRSGNYVLTAVVFALVLFFAGVASRARRVGSRRLLFVMAVVVLLVGVGILATLPVTI